MGVRSRRQFLRSMVDAGAACLGWLCHRRAIPSRPQPPTQARGPVLIGAAVGSGTPADITRAAAGDGRAAAPRSPAPPCGTLDGTVIDPLDALGAWRVGMGNGAASATLTTVRGCRGQAIRLSYDLGGERGAWAQLRRDFTPFLDLSAADHLRLFYSGTRPNTLEIGLVSADDQNYFATSWPRATHVGWCTYATWDLQDFRNGGRTFPDLRRVKAVFVSAVNQATGQDVGGPGSLTVDELQQLRLASRDVPPDQPVTVDRRVIQRAAAWVAARQQPGGLLKSWQEEPADFAWLYDQAVGLLVLSETDPPRARRLADKLRALQNADGSWYAGYRHATLRTPITRQAPIGAVAWTVYALAQYVSKGGTGGADRAARRGAAWLARLQRRDGSLPALPGESTAPTEPNLGVWWAFQAVGFQAQADRLRNLLLTRVWDDRVGRFKSSPDTNLIFLDNQAWGAAFLRAVGRPAAARQALSYARWTLGTTSSATSFGSVCGFDGAGPFGVWNEGVLHYLGQAGEHSRFYAREIIKQQARDGGVPGSPLRNEFRGYTVWLTPWHGVAPTAWLYFAGTGGPFRVGRRLSLGHEELS